MIKNVLFYSQCHVGDSHLTRQYITKFPKWFPEVKFIHSHFYSKNVLLDTKTEYFNGADLLPKLPKELPYVIDEEGGTIYLNTWVYQMKEVRSMCLSTHHILHKY